MPKLPNNESVVLTASELAFVAMQLVGLTLGVVVCLIRPPGLSSYWLPLVLGTMLAQVGLASAAAVLGPWNLLTQQISAGALVAGGGLLYLLSLLRPWEEGASFPCVMLVCIIWAAMQGPFWLARLIWNLQLVKQNEWQEVSDSALAIRLFLFAAITVVVSFVLLVWRYLLPEDAGLSMWLSRWVVPVTWIVVLTVLTTLQPRMLGAGIATSAALCAVVAASAILGMVKRWSEITPTAIFFAQSYAWLLVSLLLLRSGRYRLSYCRQAEWSPNSIVPWNGQHDVRDSSP